MRNYKRLKLGARLILTSLFFLDIVCQSALAQDVDKRKTGEFYVGAGLTAHNYYYEGTFGFSSTEVSYFSSINLPPTLALGYENKKWYSGFELSLYSSFLPSNDTMFDILYLKKTFSADYYFLYKDFRLGVLYTSTENRHHLGTFSLSRQGIVDDGIGFSIGMVKNGFSFDLRKELFFGFGEYVTYIDAITDHWTLRVLKRFQVAPAKSYASKENERKPFSLSIGGVVTGNPLAKFLPSEGKVKLYASVGMEYFVERINTSAYFKRSVWYGMQSGSINFPFNSQVNHLGASYWMPVFDKQMVKVGVHHVWNLDRSLLYFDFLEKGYVFETAPSTYQNLGVGINSRFGISPQWDVSLDIDYYYKANKRLGTGFNSESFRLGLVYNIM